MQVTLEVPEDLAQLLGENSAGLTRTAMEALALEGLREVLHQRKATPAAIANMAVEANMWKVMRPYLEAMTAGA